jgi:adenylate cyclase
MNKDYGTTILASGAVVAQCSDAIAFRPLGSAQAKGRASALEIYEVLAAAAIAEQQAGEQTGTAA